MQDSPSTRLVAADRLCQRHQRAGGPHRVLVAGTVGWDANQKFQSEELVPQFEQALKNIIAILAEAGAKPDPHLPANRLCIDKPAYLAGRRELGRIWKSLIGSHFPAMSMIFVADLLDAPAKIELEATAVIPAS